MYASDRKLKIAWCDTHLLDHDRVPDRDRVFHCVPDLDRVFHCVHDRDRVFSAYLIVISMLINIAISIAKLYDHITTVSPASLVVICADLAENLIFIARQLMFSIPRNLIFILYYHFQIMLFVKYNRMYFL